MEILEHIAHITTKDGRRFQALNEAGDDWDEAETARLAREHEETLDQEAADGQ